MAYSTTWSGLDTQIVALSRSTDSTKLYLSPGCSVTETYNKDVSDVGGGAAALNNLWVTDVSNSHIIRIDATMHSILDDVASDGITHAPVCEPTRVIEDYGYNTINRSEHTLYWRGYSYTGLVKSITITQRSGEGNLYDLSITFQVGSAYQ